MSADKDRAIRRQKQKRAKQAKKSAGQPRTPAGAKPAAPTNASKQAAA